jgi:hypothetical protein
LSLGISKKRDENVAIKQSFFYIRKNLGKGSSGLTKNSGLR